METSTQDDELKEFRSYKPEGKALYLIAEIRVSKGKVLCECREGIDLKGFYVEFPSGIVASSFDSFHRSELGGEVTSMALNKSMDGMTYNQCYRLIKWR